MAFRRIISRLRIPTATDSAAEEEEEETIGGPHLHHTRVNGAVSSHHVVVGVSDSRHLPRVRSALSRSHASVRIGTESIKDSESDFVGSKHTVLI